MNDNVGFPFPHKVTRVDKQIENRLYKVVLVEGSAYNKDLESTRPIRPHRPPFKLNISKIKDIACTDYYVLLLKNNGIVYTYGSCTNFNLPYYIYPNPIRLKVPRIKAIACGQNHAIFLTKTGKIYAAGLNADGQLGFKSKTSYVDGPIKVNGISNVKAIACGMSHTIFLKEDGTVYGCGNNEFGQLGLGDTDNRYAPTKINMPKVKSIDAYYYHDDTVFELENGDTYECGIESRWRIDKYSSKIVPLLSPTLLTKAYRM